MQTFDFQNFQTQYHTSMTMCGNCNFLFSVQSLFLINAERTQIFEDLKSKGIQDLHHLDCPNCHWKQPFHPSFFVYFPSSQNALLVVAQQDRYRFLEEKAEMLKKLSMLSTNALPIKLSLCSVVIFV